MVDPQWNIFYWGSKWNLHTVCWSAVGCEWGTTSVYFGITYVSFISSRLPVFAVEPQYLLQFFYFCQKYHLNYTYKIFKKFNVGLKFSSIWGFLSCLCEGLPGIAYANMLVTTQWPLKRAATSPHLSGFVFNGCLESLTELSALCLLQSVSSWGISKIAQLICNHLEL